MARWRQRPDSGLRIDYVGNGKAYGYVQWLCVEPKKLVEAHQISTDDREDYLSKGCALIRANFGVDPYGLDDERWSELFAEAAWLEDYRLKNQAKMLVALFGESKN